MQATISRRQALRRGGMAAGFLALGGRGRAAGPGAVVESRRVITRRPHLYHGWPTLARRANDKDPRLDRPALSPSGVPSDPGTKGRHHRGAEPAGVGVR